MKLILVSDIHSNLEALEVVLKEIDRLKIKNILCVGDVIGPSLEKLLLFQLITYLFGYLCQTKNTIPLFIWCEIFH
ncbi:MAG: hypothetical protein DRP58_10320 [Spirochaetes bacterium]|nr:MAG: hypothetical protein DRP58_10320 [Spirochaetota bacterium]